MGETRDNEADAQCMHQHPRAAVDLDQRQQDQHQRGVLGEVSEDAAHAVHRGIAAVAEADPAAETLADHKGSEQHAEKAGQGGVEGGDERQGRHGHEGTSQGARTKRNRTLSWL
jgi:hypothetical protein